MKRIFIYLLLSISLFGIFLASPGFKSEVTPLGSVMSAYFYNKHTKGYHVYATYALHIKRVTDFKLKKFYKTLDWSSKGTIVDFKSDIDKTWQLYNQKGKPKENYLQYWQTVRPFTQKFYDEKIPKMKVNHPIVHFRCSDAPFVTHPLYHLSKRNSVQWMIDKIKAQGYQEVTILSCNRHRRVKNNTCGLYLKYYTQLFTDSEVKVKTECHDVFTDFTLMVNAPVLVSLNPSSFGFMAGIAKEPSKYISCNLGTEFNNSYLLQDQADWLMAPYQPLLHSEVIDYKDAKKVISQLTNN